MFNSFFFCVCVELWLKTGEPLPLNSRGCPRGWLMSGPRDAPNLNKAPPPGLTRQLTDR